MIKIVGIFLLTVLLVQSTFAAHHNPDESIKKTQVGYDSPEGVRIPLYAGSLDTVDIWMRYMKAHDDNDLEAIRRANADDFKAWASDGRVIESTEAQMALLRDWFDTSNPKWVHRYSIASEFTDREGNLQQWVTTGWDLTETVDGIEVKRQEIFDVLIVEGKIKNIYIAARPINESE